MKITKKTPLRPRGRGDEKRQSTKDAIRDAYTNGPQREVQIIPAKKDLIPEKEKRKLRVCAYCRVSTDEDSQASSYELQVQNYTKMIQENDEWEFAGIFADEGISGTSVLRREHFLEMIEKCKAGEIDLIITKQVSRFARNVLDSLNYIFMLRKLNPPVGVYFETEKLNTLDKSSDMVITVLSLVAQSESEQKSNSLKWSFKRRRAQGLGIYPNWALLGYDMDEYKNWIIIDDEADVVRTIYGLYLEGYSSGQIAELLTKSGIPTVKGLPVWSPGSVLGILRNEKYCGDALCQKTVTIDFFTHKSVKNNGFLHEQGSRGTSSCLYGDGNSHLDRTLDLYSFSTAMRGGGRMIVRSAALVFGGLICNFPSTNLTCLVTFSSPVSKLISSHRSPSNSPRRKPVERSSRNIS